ncbi:MAG: hypothetical protein GY866_21490 [Proteobacteria bacterium]|nr:hypothetical protein [Pseudomonadota bacterium]
MEKSAKQLKWSKTYFRSYKKTAEAAYLRIAAAHCNNAILSYDNIQSLLSKTNRFYHQVKSKKLQACRFYRSLQNASQRLDPEHRLPDIGNNVCER